MDAHQREDQDRHFEDDAHAKDERRDEGEVLGRTQLILDDRVAEADEEFQRAREQSEVAEEHPCHEQQEHERTSGECEAPLVGVQGRIDIGVDLEEDHGHREGDTAEQSDAHVGREVLGRAQRDEMIDARRDEQDLDDVGREEEGDRRRRDHRDRGHHQPVAELSQMLDEREFLVAFGHRWSR